MLGSEAPRAPLTNTAAKTQNHLISSAPEERSTRSNASTTGLSRRIPPIGRSCRCRHGNPDWNVIQSSRVNSPAHWLEPVPNSLRESVQRFCERVRERGGGAIESLVEERWRELAVVVAASEFAAGSLIQDPGALAWLARSESDAPAANAEYARTVAAAATLAEAQRILREWRRREMLRIAWRDIAARARVEETLRAVSDFADACIRAAVRRRARICRRSSARRAAAPAGGRLIVLGMGKLGGRELNFSSDIDLVFLFAEGGETDGPRVIANEEYFNRLGRELIRLLDARTEEGFVFRVDMRLRPFGESGPLVVSLAALEDYLQQHGRDWERYAWIKARAIVGAEAYAAAHAEFVRPFVYRRYLDFGVFESLREMKALIAREVARRELEQDSEARPGRHPRDRVHRAVHAAGARRQRPAAAARLAARGAAAAGGLEADVGRGGRAADGGLPGAAQGGERPADDSRSASASLPDDPQDRARLCVALGVAEWPEALARIERARAIVAGRFEAWLFAARRSARRSRSSAWAGSTRPTTTWREDSGGGGISARRDRGGRGAAGCLSAGGALSAAG